MKTNSSVRVGLLILTAAISLSCMSLSKGEQEDTILNQPIFVQIGTTSDMMVLNKSNMTPLNKTNAKNFKMGIIDTRIPWSKSNLPYHIITYCDRSV